MLPPRGRYLHTQQQHFRLAAIQRSVTKCLLHSGELQISDFANTMGSFVFSIVLFLGISYSLQVYAVLCKQ
jgi:hypothetical protein